MKASLWLVFLFACVLATRAHELSIQIPQRVAPGTAVNVRISVVASGLSSTTKLEAVFAGSAPLWPGISVAVLPQITRLGSTFVLGSIVSAPLVEGLYDSLRWVVRTTKGDPVIIGQITAHTLEVTCSDGVYCNGIERLVRGTCVSSPVLPCVSPSGDPCASYQCIEANRSCARTPIGGASCSVCLPDACKASCRGKACGDDGCGGSCGTCATGQFCVDGACGSVTQPGSCANPEPMPTIGGVVPNAGAIFDILGDNRQGLDMTQPVCNSPGIPEYVYKFTVNIPMGVEIRMTAADGSNGLDTLLALHDANCQPFTLTAADRLCSDDQTPPGNLASRVDGLLPPGTYTLIASAYATSTLGAYKLAVKFTPNCGPKCEGKFCGDDGCGGSCGACANGTQCFSGRCQAVPCTPNCKSRSCGDDGCGGICGVCKNKQVCDVLEGSCVPVKSCSNFAPQCQGTGSQNQFCGSDCQWHKLDEPMPDLVPNEKSEVLSSAYFQWIDFPETSCAIAEGCVLGSGRRLLLRFDTRVHNVGTGHFVGPNIGKSPHLFTWAACHQHYHFEKFARFALYNTSADAALALPGAKLSYCMEDAERYASGSDVACSPQFDCLDQGIPRGRTDNYPASLDCQWLDITSLQPKNAWYTYEVCTNIGRTLFEMTFDNNCVRFPIYVPQVADNGQIVKYTDIVPNP